MKQLTQFNQQRPVYNVYGSVSADGEKVNKSTDKVTAVCQKGFCVSLSLSFSVNRRRKLLIFTTTGLFVSINVHSVTVQ